MVVGKVRFMDNAINSVKIETIVRGRFRVNV